jgi:hypothetical protein
MGTLFQYHSRIGGYWSYPQRKAIKPLLLSIGVVLSFFFNITDAHASIIIQRPLYIGLTTGLVGYWSFDGPDMNATKALDQNGRGNDGTPTNVPVYLWTVFVKV